jgi:hypothetical protein
MPAPNIRIEPAKGGAETPGNTSTMNPVTAMMKPTIWIMFKRSPLCSPQRIIVAWTAPNKSKAPVPAERDLYANEKPAAYTTSATAEIQLPYRSDKSRARSEELQKVSTNREAVRSAIILLRTLSMSQSATAPEKIRMNVKVAGSMLPFVNAARQRSELLAKAIIARSVSMKIRRDLSIDGIQRRTVRCKCIMINQLELVKRYQSVQRFFSERFANA